MKKNIASRLVGAVLLLIKRGAHQTFYLSIRTP